MHTLFLETSRVAGGEPDSDLDDATLSQWIADRLELIRIVLNQAANAVSQAEITAAVEKMKQELALSTAETAHGELADGPFEPNCDDP